jgi:RHS repeat-associated protein
VVGNLSPVTSYTFYVGTGAVLSPTTGAQTAANVTLSGQSKSTATGITYQWCRGNTDTWITIPAADVKTTSGAVITWPVATTGAGAYPNLVWNVAQTVNNAEPGANPLDGPVQVRASLSGSSTGTSTGVSFTLDRDRKEAATTGIGPGAVNLLTGNFTVRTTDAATLGELGLDRTFNSRLAGDMDPLFGPGWTSSFVAVDAGTYTELSVTGTLVQVGLGDGDTLGFTKATSATSGATFTAEVGTGNSTLAYTNSTDSYLLTEATGDTVTFSRRTGDPVGLYTPTHLQSAGTAASSSISWQKVTVGGVDVVRPTQILAEVPSGVTCTTLVRGCRALKFTYASTTTATTGTPGDYLGRLQKVELTAWDPDLSIPAMRTVTLQQYAYDSNGRLASSWDPRLDYTNGAGSLHVATAYAYNTNGTLATLTVPGEQPWTFTYTTIPTDSGAGRLYKATRSALTSGTNVQTVVTTFLSAAARHLSTWPPPSTGGDRPPCRSTPPGSIPATSFPTATRRRGPFRRTPSTTASLCITWTPRAERSTPCNPAVPSAPPSTTPTATSCEKPRPATSAARSTLRTATHPRRKRPSQPGNPPLPSTSDDSDSPSWISDGASYTRIIAGLVARYTGSTGSLEWQITNLHGDVVAARTASTAGVTATYITDEYGTSINGTSPKYGYLGAAQRSSDNPGGLMMMGVRLFSPVTGRFLSSDPVYGGNANSYEYRTGDPVNCTDLDGRASWPSPKQINKAEAKRCALHPSNARSTLGSVLGRTK